MPHPLPEDVGGVTGTRWFLVAVPDDPAYTRAAMDIYTSMQNYWKWGMEGPVPIESDLAAQQWANAIAETLEALAMGFPDNLLAAVDDVESILEEIRDKPCCESNDVLYDDIANDDGIIGGEDDLTGDEVFVGVGDPPGDAADWGEFDSRLCDAATKFAQNLYNWLPALDALILLNSGFTAAILAALIATLGGLGVVPTAIVGALSFGTVLGLIEGIREFFGQPWDSAAAKAQLQDPDVIDEIICAIVSSESAEQAENAVDAVLASEAPDAAAAVSLLPLRWLMAKMFNLDSNADAGFGGGCAGCVGCTSYHAAFGTITEATSEYVVVESEDSGDGKQYVYIYLNFNGSSFCGSTRTLVQMRLMPGETNDTVSSIILQDQSGNIRDQKNTNFCNQVISGTDDTTLVAQVRVNRDIDDCTVDPFTVKMWFDDP